jgi:hypothetical protein
LAVDVGLIEAVCRRAEVSRDLVKREAEGANMIQISTKDRGRTEQGDFKGSADGRDWTQDAVPIARRAALF